MSCHPSNDMSQCGESSDVQAINAMNTTLDARVAGLELTCERMNHMLVYILFQLQRTTSSSEHPAPTSYGTVFDVILQLSMGMDEIRATVEQTKAIVDARHQYDVDDQNGYIVAEFKDAKEYPALTEKTDYEIFLELRSLGKNWNRISGVKLRHAKAGGQPSIHILFEDRVAESYIRKTIHDAARKLNITRGLSCVPSICAIEIIAFPIDKYPSREDIQTLIDKNKFTNTNGRIVFKRAILNTVDAKMANSICAKGFTIDNHLYEAILTLGQGPPAASLFRCSVPTARCQVISRMSAIVGLNAANVQDRIFQMAVPVLKRNAFFVDKVMWYRHAVPHWAESYAALEAQKKAVKAANASNAAKGKPGRPKSKPVQNIDQADTPDASTSPLPSQETQKRTPGRPQKQEVRDSNQMNIKDSLANFSQRTKEAASFSGNPATPPPDTDMTGMDIPSSQAMSVTSDHASGLVGGGTGNSDQMDVDTANTSGDGAVNGQESERQSAASGNNTKSKQKGTRGRNAKNGNKAKGKEGSAEPKESTQPPRGRKESQESADGPSNKERATAPETKEPSASSGLAQTRNKNGDKSSSSSTNKKKNSKGRKSGSSSKAKKSQPDASPDASPEGPQQISNTPTASSPANTNTKKASRHGRSGDKSAVAPKTPVAAAQDKDTPAGTPAVNKTAVLASRPRPVDKKVGDSKSVSSGASVSNTSHAGGNPATASDTLLVDNGPSVRSPSASSQKRKRARTANGQNVDAPASEPKRKRTSAAVASDAAEA
ncbi:hypothetical protein F53441_11932 [Fusarium austroafricanum]|uniref:Uncharacterized protein n=1 Tax=Fusarium austroafricanum TaxID=2364996 RepID=A0A8H4JZE9_9HYPO|nr:hypothetical protein F53441_11932 [Fusarium austroafricanum]